VTHEVRSLDQWGTDQLAAIIARNPVRHCYAASRLVGRTRGFLRPTHSDLLGCFEDGRLASALVLGANVVPVQTTAATRREFATALARAGRRCSSIVGPAAEALELWTLLEPRWGYARAVRASQPVMATQQVPAIAADERVRYAVRSDLDVVLPACIDMFTSEVGISPVAHGGGPAYRNRIAELIAQRRSLVRIDEGRIVFKAEVGVIGAGVAQVQGVWVHPDLRGRGLAVPAMAAVVRTILADIAPTVSLYVNDFNAAAIATYRHAGFEQVDEFATVLF
jgi:predicted GNAT family acetyltransferase